MSGKLYVQARSQVVARVASYEVIPSEQLSTVPPFCRQF